MNFIARELDNLGSDLATATVEDHNAITAFHPKHVAGVVGFASAQNQCVAIPSVRRDIEAMDRHCKLTVPNFKLPGTSPAPNQFAIYNLKSAITRFSECRF